MRRSANIVAALLASTGLAAMPAPAAAPPSRLIVSSTLNGTLHVFDAQTLAETQPPLPGKGTSPVRLWVQRFDGKSYLFSANHGVQGSVGVFDLDGDVVTELPLSPFPSGGQGSVGVVAGYVGRITAQPTPVVFVTDTVQALGGCGLPEGSVSAFDASLLSTVGVLRRFASAPSGGVIPYAVAFDGERGDVLVSNNCDDNLVQFTVGASGVGVDGPRPVTWDFTLARTGAGATADGPDAVLFDPVFHLTYVANIGGDGVSVFGRGLGADGTAAATVVALPNAGPIDATLADSPSGARWLVTSNGQDDTVSLIDRAAIAQCVVDHVSACDAEVATIYAGVQGGAPEGVAYDPATNRVFVVNKTLGEPALSVIQLTESAAGVTGAHTATIPLNALGGGTPLPDIIAFDVVVQTR